MIPQEAQRIGRIKTLLVTAIIVVILLVIFMFMETSGDFANGILFFIEAISNIHFLTILTILFGLTFIFGGIAGKEIILQKKNFIWISIKYPVLIILAIVIYAAIIGIAKDKTSSINNSQRLLITYFLRPLAKTGSIIILPMFAIWLGATNSIRLKNTKTNKP